MQAFYLILWVSYCTVYKCKVIQFRKDGYTLQHSQRAKMADALYLTGEFRLCFVV